MSESLPELGSKEGAEVIGVKERRKRFPGWSKNLLEEPDQGQGCWNTESQGKHGQDNAGEIGRS